MRPQFIIGIKTETLIDKIGLKTNVINPVDLAQIVHLVQEGIVIGQREALENDPSVRQVLPYVIISKRCKSSGKMLYVPYQRTKKVGESRLAGNVSVGFGGHIDLADVVHEGSVVNLLATVGGSIHREMEEEVQFTGIPEGEELGIFSVGILLDDTNEVGKVHMGVILNIQVGEDVEVACKEEELITMQPMTAECLLNSGYSLENWTVYALELFKDLEEEHL